MSESWPAPRCGRPMRRVEQPGRAVTGPAACARPAGHSGPHKSAASLAAAAIRLQQWRAAHPGWWRP